MARGASFPIYILGITHMHGPQHQSHSLLVSRNQDQVDMVVHQTICEHSDVILHGVLVHQETIFFEVRLLDENILSIISALSDMMGDTRHNDASASWHKKIPSGLGIELSPGER